MPGTVRLMLGSEVTCTDGDCGRAQSLVVDPKARRVTHLVAEPEHRTGLGRLVPMDLVSAAEPATGRLQLSCDLATFDKLPRAEETEVVLGAAVEYGRFTHLDGPPPLETDVHELVPPGELSMSSKVIVSATDGPIGQVAGLVTEAESYVIVAVVAREDRFLLGHRDMAIPMSAVAHMRGGVHLNLATADVPER